MHDIYDNDFDKAFDEAVEAIEKKEHRLIWADALKKHYSWWQGGTLEKTLDEMKRDFDTIIDLQPTVEAEPIKHGRWIWRGGNLYECSECEAIVVAQDYIPIELHKFCRGCGAKMDESTMGQLNSDEVINYHIENDGTYSAGEEEPDGH